MSQTRSRPYLGVLGVVAVALALATTASAFTLWPYDLPKQPELYTIRGYLDRAPEGAKIIDRTDIKVNGRPRLLLVSWYGTPGETTLDRQLSRNLAHTFVVRGSKEQVTQLAEAPPGTEIEGTFVAYTDGPPWLRIASLEVPAAPKPGS